MPRLLDTGSRTDEVVATVVHLIGTRGLRAVTLRAVAEQMRMAPSSLEHHLTDLDRIWRLTLHRTARRLLDEWSGRVQHEGVAGILPQDGAYDQEERHLLGQAASYDRDAPRLDALHALVHGLRQAICRRVEAMDPVRARTVLTGTRVGTGRT